MQSEWGLFVVATFCKATVFRFHVHLAECSCSLRCWLRLSDARSHEIIRQYSPTTDGIGVPRRTLTIKMKLCGRIKVLRR